MSALLVTLKYLNAFFMDGWNMRECVRVELPRLNRLFSITLIVLYTCQRHATALENTFCMAERQPGKQDMTYGNTEDSFHLKKGQK